MLCCAKNHLCESPCVTSPLRNSCSPPNIKLFCGNLQVEDVVRQLNKRSELLHVVSEMCVNLLLLLFCFVLFFSKKKTERTLLTKSIVRRRLDRIVLQANTFHTKNQKKNIMDFIHRLQRSNHFVWHNKLYRRKVPLSNFHLNGRTL